MGLLCECYLSARSCSELLGAARSCSKLLQLSTCAPGEIGEIKLPAMSHGCKKGRTDSVVCN